MNNHLHKIIGIKAPKYDEYDDYNQTSTENIDILMYTHKIDIVFC